MVYCTPAHRFGSDALLLARFCAPKRAQKAADLCSGCGIVALEWHDRGHRGPCTALELQPEGSALLAEAVAQQGLDHITPVCADLRSWREGEGSFDLCACNPPYFTDGPQSANAAHALARGIKVLPVHAASACVTALAVSGQDTSRWVFEGFLPVNRKQKKERLADLLQEKRTVIFYEAPHKLRTTLDDLTNAFGADRSITLCRELTKLHEDIWKTTLGEAVEHYKVNDPRGEYVLVMAGAPDSADPEQELTLEQAAQRALELTGQGFGPTAAAKAAAQGTPYSKSEVYKQLLVLQQGQQEQD